MAIRRRAMLQAAAGAAVVASPLAFLFRREAMADGGPLVADPARVLDLPAGFRYTILQRAFEPMSDGLKVPGRPDGMACFTGPGDTLILMRNHELDKSLSDAGYDSPPPESFDVKAGGGVTRLVLNKSLESLSSNRILAGTLRNCAGGASPWGWLSCEESIDPGHGYVFRCRTDAARLAPPERLAGYGRFRHEAAVVDPKTLTVFLSEDQTDGCFYRYKPADLSKPHTSGKLQALRVINVPRFDTSRDLDRGIRLKVDWRRSERGSEGRQRAASGQRRRRRAFLPRRGRLLQQRRRAPVLHFGRAPRLGPGIQAHARQRRRARSARAVCRIARRERARHARQHLHDALG